MSRAEYYRALGAFVPIFNTILPPRNVLIRSGTELPMNDRWQLAMNPIFATATGGTIETKTATATTNSTTTPAVTAGASPSIGSTVTGAGIPAGTTITAQPAGVGFGNYTLSQVATASATGVAVTITAVSGPVPANWTLATVGQSTGTATSQVNPNGLGNNAVVTCN